MSDVPALAVVGSASVDLVSPVERPPRRGETVRAGELRIGPGGKGANQAVAARRLGAAVELIARVGADPLGEQLRGWLGAAGLAGAGIETSATAPTGVASILVEPDGANRIVYAPGANDELDAAQATRALAASARLDCLLGGFEVRDEPLLAAARIARERGATTILNPAPARPLDAELLDLLDWIVLNESEFEQLRGAAPDPGALAAAAREWGCGVVATLGAGGAALADGERVRTRPAPAVRAVDTTGAGDSFLGAFAWGLGRGDDPLRAVELGVAAGSFSVARAGVQESFASRAALLRLAPG